MEEKGLSEALISKELSLGETSSEPAANDIDKGFYSAVSWPRWKKITQMATATLIVFVV
jgi:hypothetical protein